MEKLDIIREILKEKNLYMLEKYNENKLFRDILEILEHDIENFNYEEDVNYDYLLEAIQILPNYFSDKINKKETYEKLNKMHYSIREYLIKKPGNITKTSYNFRLLKNLISNIEVFIISLLYNYVDKYEENKYELIEYIIFDVKNISLLKDAIKKFPYIVNYFDENNNLILNKIIDKYIYSLRDYAGSDKLNSLDDLIYYDEVIDLFLENEKLVFDIVNKQNNLRKINGILSKLTNQRYKDKIVFHLNDLANKIENQEIEETLNYLEYKYDIKTYFNEAIKSETTSIIKNVKTDNNLEVLNEYILTFDGEGAKEIDDALSIRKLENGNYRLMVHIADPLSVIKTNSIIFDEARKRTTSIYLSNITIPMIPELLSSDLISLKENELRHVVTYSFEIDKDGNVIDYNFKKNIIKVNKNMTYDEFNQILKNGSDDSEKLNTILLLEEISPLLQKYYNSNELYQQINRSSSNISNTNIIGLTESEKVVESAMVFTNYMVANYFKENNLLFPFRNHNVSIEMINKLNELEESIKIENNSQEYVRYIELAKNIYPRSVYETENKGHFGLDLSSYCHITSPLRRFSDIIGLICLNIFYFKEHKEIDMLKFEKFLIETCEEINKKRTPIEKFSSRYEYIKIKSR